MFDLTVTAGWSTRYSADSAGPVTFNALIFANA
jgi:hypothetical protein